MPASRKSSKHIEVICPLCADLARAQDFQEIPICHFENLICEDCPIDWSKLVKK